MKKLKTILLLVSATLSCLACSNQENEINTSKISEEIKVHTEESEEETQEEKSVPVEKVEQIEGLNLDGLGENDDSIMITSYLSETEEVTLFVELDVILGTGENLNRTYQGDKRISIITGDLFQEEYDAIMVHVGAVGSNYGASDIYVYEIVRGDEAVDLEERIVFLDGGSKKDIRSIKASIFHDYSDDIINEGELIFIEELQQYGVSLKLYDKEARPYFIVYWQENEWKLFEEGNLEHEVDR